MISKIHCDGGSRSNPGPAASAFVAYDESGNIIYKQGKYLGQATNNVAEYQGVILALNWLNTQNENVSSPLAFYLDSQLIVNQLNGVYRIKEQTLLGLATEVKTLERNLNYKIIFNHVLRSFNKDADLLVNETLDGQK